jgi:hypothetical protein
VCCLACFKWAPLEQAFVTVRCHLVALRDGVAKACTIVVMMHIPSLLLVPYLAKNMCLCDVDAVGASTVVMLTVWTCSVRLLTCAHAVANDAVSQ